MKIYHFSFMTTIFIGLPHAFWVKTGFMIEMFRLMTTTWKETHICIQAFNISIFISAVIWRFISFFLYRRSLRFNEVMLNRVSSGKFNPYNVINVVNGCQFGDWLFLYYLAKNMQGFVFQWVYFVIVSYCSFNVIKVVIGY